MCSFRSIPGGLFLIVVLAAQAINPPGPAAVPLPGLYNPVADPKAVVIVGNARFTVLTPQLIRMEWAADGKFEDHASLAFLNRRLPVPKFSQANVSLGRTKDASPVLQIQTEDLSLTYQRDVDSGRGFTARNLRIEFNLNGKKITWHPGLPDTGNLQGTTRTLDNALGAKIMEPISPGLISRDGWVLVDDSARPLFDSNDFRFDKGEKSAWPWVMQRPAGNRQDWYFFGYGHRYKAALRDFTRVAGKIPLPPYFAFGAWWSRYWAYTDEELLALAHDFRGNDVPLDVMVIDMDWHLTFDQDRWVDDKDSSGNARGWTGYSWNKTLFPRPERFLKELHAQGLRTTLNLHPASGIQPWENAYPAMAMAMGVDPRTGVYVPFDVTSKKWTLNYFDLVLHPLEKQGVDFWWIDWQQGNTTEVKGVNPTFWLNYVHFSDQEREGKRPLMLGRWGGLGNHRYEIGFSGDTISAWESLAFQPWFTATAANVAYAYWSHDIGGHLPGDVESELFTRWVQYGVFSPILRTHATKSPTAERRIWAYPEPYSSIMRKFYDERYAMLPYVYTEARRTYDTGLAFVHPLYYDWPEAKEAYQMKDEYVFGSQMIVSPVVTPVDKTSGLAKQEVWIPRGEWIERDTGAHFKGPVKVERSFSIDQIPVYVRQGAIVPMAPRMQSTDQKPLDPLIVAVYPPAQGQRSWYSLYEDAGDTRGYETGQFATTQISAFSEGDDVTVTIAPAKGSYPGMIRARAFEVRLVGDRPPASVLLNGKPAMYAPQPGKIGWRYEDNTLTTVVTTAAVPVSQPTTIKVTRSRSLVSRRAGPNGFAGTPTQLQSAVQTLQWPFPFDSVSQELERRTERSPRNPLKIWLLR